MTVTTCHRLSDDVCVVTGAGGNIGRGIADRLAAEGARVVIVDSNVEQGQKAEAAINDASHPGEAKFVRVDVTDEAAVKGIMHAVEDEWGSIDGLVNNVAGITNTSDIASTADENVLDVSEELWDRVFAVTLKSAFFCTKHATSIMAGDGGGAIVNVASVATHRDSPENVAESGLHNFTRQTAVDLAAHEIRVNTLSTGRTGSVVDHDGSRRDTRRNLRGRTGDPEDYAAAVAYLLSDDADFVTGIELPVDGGTSASF